MSDKTDELSVQLNEAFERLEGETASAEKPDAQQSGRQKSRSEATFKLIFSYFEYFIQLIIL